MAITLYDGDWITPHKEGPARFSQPFDGTAFIYILEQDYVIRVGFYTPLALGTPSPDFGTYLLVKESPLQPVGVGDIVKWTRTYAQVPATRYDFTSIAYTFPGWMNYRSSLLIPDTSYVPGRAQFTKTVTCRIQYDYFQIGVAPYTTADLIPVNYRTKYYQRAGFLTSLSPPTIVWNQLYTLGSLEDYNYGLEFTLLYDIATDTINTPAYVVPNIVIPMNINRTLYNTWIAAGTPVVAEDSNLSRWMGNIYVRATKTVLPQ